MWGDGAGGSVIGHPDALGRVSPHRPARPPAWSIRRGIIFWRGIMVVNILKILLVLTNFSLLTNLLVLIINHYHFQYNMKSWASIFHFLTLIWLLIRGAFWISTLFHSMRWTVVSFYMLYWMPTPFEFGSFLILPLYFANILYPQEWAKYWPYVRPVYFGTVAGIACMQTLYCGLSTIPKQIQCMNVSDDDFKQSDCFHTEVSSQVFRATTAVCFLFLAIMQFIFGVKIVTIDEQRYNQYISIPREVLSVVNLVLVGSFLTRSVYQLMALCEIYILPDVPMQGDGDMPLVVFLITQIWVYVPTYLIVSQVTSRSFGSLAGSSMQRRGLATGSYPGRASGYGATSSPRSPSDEDELMAEGGEEEDEDGTPWFLVPSRSSSSFRQKRPRYGNSEESQSPSEMIPINRAASSHDSADLSTQLVSLSQSKSWLSETEAQRYWKPRAASLTSAQPPLPIGDPHTLDGQGVGVGMGMVGMGGFVAGMGAPTPGTGSSSFSSAPSPVLRQGSDKSSSLAQHFLQRMRVPTAGASAAPPSPHFRPTFLQRSQSEYPPPSPHNGPDGSTLAAGHRVGGVDSPRRGVRFASPHKSPLAGGSSVGQASSSLTGLEELWQRAPTFQFNIGTIPAPGPMTAPTTVPIAAPAPAPAVSPIPTTAPGGASILSPLLGVDLLSPSAGSLTGSLSASQLLTLSPMVTTPQPVQPLPPPPPLLPEYELMVEPASPTPSQRWRESGIDLFTATVRSYDDLAQVDQQHQQAHGGSGSFSSGAYEHTGGDHMHPSQHLPSSASGGNIGIVGGSVGASGSGSGSVLFYREANTNAPTGVAAIAGVVFHPRPTRPSLYSSPPQLEAGDEDVVVARGSMALDDSACSSTPLSGVFSTNTTPTHPFYEAAPSATSAVAAASVVGQPDDPARRTQHPYQGVVLPYNI